MDASTSPTGSGAVGYTESINQPTKIRLASGAEIAITDWSWMTLYSTIDILDNATDAELAAFTYVQGDKVFASNNIVATPATLRTATLKDCNNTGKASMPAEEEFICYGLAVELWQFHYDVNGNGETAYLIDQPALPIARAGNIAIAMTKLIVSLEVTQKDFYQNSLSWFSQGGGPSMVVASPNAGTLRTYANNGLPTKDAIDRSPVPVHIGGTEKYRVVYSNPDGQPIRWVVEAGTVDTTAVIRAKTNMVGLRKRSAA